MSAVPFGKRRVDRLVEPATASELVTPSSRPDVYATLGRAYAAVGEPRRAVELFEHGLDELPPEDSAARVRFGTYLSYALTDMGDLERAKSVVESTLDAAGETSDPYTRVRLYWSLGRISQEQAKPLVALEHFRRAVALLEATEDTLHLARAHLSCAGALIASGQDLDDAGRHIDRAERLLSPNPEPDDLAVVHRMRAMRAARAGEFDDAEKEAREAIELAAELPNERAQATWALAEALAGRGDAQAADVYGQATDLLEAHGTLRERAEALRAYGRYLRSSGREADALDVLERAADVAAELQREPLRSSR